MHVLAIAGSLRTGSFNAALLRAALGHLPAEATVTWETGLRDLPHYDQDLDDAGGHPLVDAFRARCAAADAVLVAAPEYNTGLPSALKNALDWASRPFGNSPLKGTAAAVIGTSTGRSGAARAVEQARFVLLICGARLTDAHLAVPSARPIFDADPVVLPDDVAGALAGLVGELVTLASEPPATPG
ncbi:MAG: NADPH-dependent FMN reductase [Acidimicrobiales bacterium]